MTMMFQDYQKIVKQKNDTIRRNKNKALKNLPIGTQTANTKIWRL